jgi:hypothetical protein
MRIIDRWQELETVCNTTPVIGVASDYLQALGLMATEFNVNGADKIIMFEKGLTSFPDLQKALPSYNASKFVGTIGEVSERLAHAYSYHREQHGLELSAVAFNKRLILEGLLATVESGSGKKFKVITGTGLDYGKNVVPKQKSTQSQPHWYDDTILELYEKIS